MAGWVVICCFSPFTPRFTNTHNSIIAGIRIPGVNISMGLSDFFEKSSCARWGRFGLVSLLSDEAARVAGRRERQREALLFFEIYFVRLIGTPNQEITE
jgi:hypothetical protein